MGNNTKVDKHHSFRHGFTGTHFYTKWNSMMGRCYRPSQERYPLYGGRGIQVCKGWQTFDGFLQDMYGSYKDHLQKYGKENTTLERIDTDGNYQKANCKWATRSEQALNRRNSAQITYNGQTKNLSVWANELGIKFTTLHMRIRVYKWPLERALQK